MHIENHICTLDKEKRVIFACTLGRPMLVACNGKKDVSASVHGVNYSDQEFTYVMQDPFHLSNQTGGETIRRYEAGGCRFTLPEKWRPGIKSNIEYTYYLPKKPDGSLPEIRKSTVVEMPRYDKPDELWVLRNADGSMGIASSIYQPDHPKWPGKIKGWPVPSLAYRRERWGVYMKHELDTLEASETMLNNLLSEKIKEMQEDLEFEMARNDAGLALKFKGWDDPEYFQYLKKNYKNSLVRNSGIVKSLSEAEP